MKLPHTEEGKALFTDFVIYRMLFLLTKRGGLILSYRMSKWGSMCSLSKRKEKGVILVKKISMEKE